MALARVEPLEFFTVDSLKAGWFLIWRLWLRLLAVYLPGGILFALLGIAFMGQAGVTTAIPILGGLLVLLSIYPLIRFTNSIASSWAEKRYGRALTQGVWWGITWRSWLVGLAMSVGIGVAQLLFSGAYALVGAIAGVGLAIAQIVLTLQASGWAMSVMVARRLEGVELPTVAAGTPAAPRPVARTSAPVTVGAEGTVQCPKCGGHETEKGGVIGWHCQVCGWWESRG